MTTQQSNILISKFMGRDPGELEPGQEVYLTYDTDWNELMKVVGKIESMFKKSIQFYIKDCRAYLEMDTQKAMAFELPNVPDCYSGFCKTKKQAVYKTSLQFIDWFNNQKQ